jgi:hypothetical protein
MPVSALCDQLEATMENRPHFYLLQMGLTRQPWLSVYLSHSVYYNFAIKSPLYEEFPAWQRIVSFHHCRIKKASDIVNVVMISTDNGSAEDPVINHYREFMAQHKVTGQARVKCIDRKCTTIPDGIIEAAKETDTNILVMGIAGYG